MGVKPGATEKELLAAYRRKAKQVHPDANPGDKRAAARMAALSDSYRRLSGEQPVQRSSRRPSDPMEAFYRNLSWEWVDSGRYGQQVAASRQATDTRTGGRYAQIGRAHV